MSFLDAFACPYCGAALLRESYLVRCGAQHRFTARLEREGGDSSDEPPAGTSAGAVALVLRVVDHPDRREVGRVHVFPVADG